MDIDIACNTEDEVLFAHIARNSGLNLPWVASVDAHEGHAVLVGGGPSLEDTLPLLRWRKEQGHTIFALNNAAKWLAERGIAADYTVIIDARALNREFIGHAKAYLVSSQCHPDVVDAAVAAGPTTLWHPVIEGVEAHIPPTKEAALIGGGTTVGLSALCLAYTLGYRKLHCFGYDSSHREGAGHVYAQPANAADPVAKVTVFGRTFRASIAMAWQAKLFPELVNGLIDAGAVVTVDGDGLLPWIVRETARLSTLTEQQKYEELWKRAEYRLISPGEHCVDAFIDLVEPQNHRVIDFGCGTGRAALKLHEIGCDVLCVDFADNCRDPAAKDLRFVRHDLTQPWPLKSAPYGFCTDVMEHIAPPDVGTVLRNVMSAADTVFFQISTVPDHMGALIGHPLHLTVQPISWWRETFQRLGYRVQWEQEQPAAALFLVSNT